MMMTFGAGSPAWRVWGEPEESQGGEARRAEGRSSAGEAGRDFVRCRAKSDPSKERRARESRSSALRFCAWPWSGDREPAVASQPASQAGVAQHSRAQHTAEEHSKSPEEEGRQQSSGSEGADPPPSLHSHQDLFHSPLNLFPPRLRRSPLDSLAPLFQVERKKENSLLSPFPLLDSWTKDRPSRGSPQKDPPSK